MYYMTKYIYYICVVVLLFISCSIQPNRTYFTINPEDRKIVLPVQINDSLAVRLAFDSGAKMGALVLDSAFCANYPAILNKDSLNKLTYSGSAWAEFLVLASHYKINTDIKISGRYILYDKFRVFDWKGHFLTSDSEGLFNK